MAYFRWKGEPARSWIASYGPTLKIRMHHKDGTVHEHVAPDQVNGYAIDEDIAGDVQDERCLRALRADSRFEEYVP